MPDEITTTIDERRLESLPKEIDTPELIAYRVAAWPDLKLVPAARARQWMDDSQLRFAYRCLPLLMANQAGWFMLNAHPFQAIWTGGWDPSCIRIKVLDGSLESGVLSHFGEGVITWHVPYLFRTPPGYNLLARGPSNWPKDGVYALEGLVESDWSVATFTMNWKITRRNEWVTFEKDEPICMIVPQRRGDLERFRPSVRGMESDPDSARRYQEWRLQRGTFLRGLHSGQAEVRRQGWQRHYFQGMSVDGMVAPEHQAKLELAEFVDLRGSGAGNNPAGPPAPPMPEVAAHPEAVDLLRRVARGEAGVDEALGELRTIAGRYLWPGASAEHGSIVGALMCRAIYPPGEGAMPMERVRMQWETLRAEPPSRHAADGAVATFGVAVAGHSGEALVEDGWKRLWDERLRDLLPAWGPLE